MIFVFHSFFKGDTDRKRPPCPYSASRENEHREGCECFMANLEKVPGWEENMEEGFESE